MINSCSVKQLLCCVPEVMFQWAVRPFPLSCRQATSQWVFVGWFAKSWSRLVKGILGILVHICFKGRTGEVECLGSSAELGEHVWYWGVTDEGLWESRSIQRTSESLPASVWHLCQFWEVQGKTAQAGPGHVSRSVVPVNYQCWLYKLPAVRC